MPTECTCAAKDMPFGRCCKAPAAAAEAQPAEDCVLVPKELLKRLTRAMAANCDDLLRGMKAASKAQPVQAPAAPVQAPLTEDQVSASDEFMHLNASLLQLSMPQLMLLVRAIERAHGIGVEPLQTTKG